MINLRLAGLKVGLVSTAQSLLTGACAVYGDLLFHSTASLTTANDGAVYHVAPAVMNYLFAERYHIEPTQVAAMVLFGNFFSLLSLPILLFIALSL